MLRLGCRVETVLWTRSQNTAALLTQTGSINRVWLMSRTPWLIVLGDSALSLSQPDTILLCQFWDVCLPQSTPRPALEARKLLSSSKLRATSHSCEPKVRPAGHPLCPSGCRQAGVLEKEHTELLSSAARGREGSTTSCAGAVVTMTAHIHHAFTCAKHSPECLLMCCCL